VDLPYRWYWDESRYLISYTKSQTDPIYYFKEVTNGTDEKEYLNELIQNLDFQSLQIDNAVAIVSPTLGIFLFFVNLLL